MPRVTQLVVGGRHLIWILTLEFRSYSRPCHTFLCGCHRSDPGGPAWKLSCFLQQEMRNHGILAGSDTVKAVLQKPTQRQCGTRSGRQYTAEARVGLTSQVMEKEKGDQMRCSLKFPRPLDLRWWNIMSGLRMTDNPALNTPPDLHHFPVCPPYLWQEETARVWPCTLCSPSASGSQPRCGEGIPGGSHPWIQSS